VIRNCLIEEMGLHGLSGSGYSPGSGGFASPAAAYVNKNNTITNNVFRRVGRATAYGHGLQLSQCGDYTITHNLFLQSPRYGVTYHSSGLQSIVGQTYWGVTVTESNFRDFLFTRNNYCAFNEFVTCMYDTQDGGAYYTYGIGADNVVENNFLHDMTGLPDGALMGIYLDDGSGLTQIRRNVVARLTAANDVYPFMCKGPSSTVENNISAGNAGSNHLTVFEGWDQPTSGNLLARNVFHQANGAFIFWVAAGNWSDGYLTQMVGSSDYHVIYHPGGSYQCIKSWSTPMTWAQWKSFGFDAHSTTGADPLFANLEFDDYTLLPGSPALANGFVQVDVSTAGPTADYPF
jgi:hypothetical protein